MQALTLLAPTLLSGLAPAIAGGSMLGTISTFMGAMGAIKAGSSAKKAYRLQAEQQEAAEKDREIQRLRSLRMAQSSQRAYWGSRGVSAYTGSAATIAQQSRVSYTRESEADAYSTGREIQRLGVQGKAAQTSGYFKAATGIMDYYK